MKRLFKSFFLISILAFTSCTEFFNTDPDNITNSEDYISKDNEMYKGYLGILTKMQQAGDHAIFLTDTRADYMDVTGNAPVELQDIYNYRDTKGNAYANPLCYYAVVIACNDFFSKMREYHNRIGDSMDETAQADFKSMISSAIRIKVWAYYTLGRIYGKAYWFDDPLEDLGNLKDSTIFTPMNDMGAIVNQCVNLLDSGLVVYKNERIPANLEMNWASWLDPESANQDTYRHWNYLTPNWLLLRCELLSWRGLPVDWLWMRDNILQFMFNKQNQDPLADPYYPTPNSMYACNIPLTGTYYQQFFTEQLGNKYQMVSGIMYDYKNDQTNRLVEYFCPAYPGKYYLRPSSYAIHKFIETDIRGITQRICMNIINGDTCFTKNYYFRGSYLKTKIFEIMPTIILQRGMDFHFLLAEAENHLGNWRQARCILNQGMTNEFTYAVYMPGDWNSNYTTWWAPNGGYGDIGIVGCVRGANHELPGKTDPGYNLTEAERIRQYDLALADEYLLEYTGEGKAYSYLIKMAERHHDPSIVADRIVPKYPLSKQAEIRSKIESGGYWVDWDLNGDNK
jgi:starch-binding outer membrane protein, SusD/RagB family